MGPRWARDSSLAALGPGWLVGQPGGWAAGSAGLVADWLAERLTGCWFLGLSCTAVLWDPFCLFPVLLVSESGASATPDTLWIHVGAQYLSLAAPGPGWLARRLAGRVAKAAGCVADWLVEWLAGWHVGLPWAAWLWDPFCLFPVLLVSESRASATLNTLWIHFGVQYLSLAASGPGWLAGRLAGRVAKAAGCVADWLVEWLPGWLFGLSWAARVWDRLFFLSGAVFLF